MDAGDIQVPHLYECEAGGGQVSHPQSKREFAIFGRQYGAAAPPGDPSSEWRRRQVDDRAGGGFLQHRLDDLAANSLLAQCQKRVSIELEIDVWSLLDLGDDE